MKTYEQIKEFLESLLIDKNIVDSIDINAITLATVLSNERGINSYMK